ncbi:helix-turn-helix domain-containing protein [Bariatricus massiliensis]|uniref:Helix-turn-helix domain-containing protein n=2 Tax=Bariatricus massiliensis TaxID=1745713 RepID=A0ABS8DGX9_9FIRM|nr:helix-turn-helix transcriptional regulator [Bariatricus massiliensis]MCB7304571.1 helix-turn-helix domain-containing protein [Bariatricus massiliensis]MCB7375223.1 helix-turn-helix domain-containing protein [Bariatricus massiliensis]MCB7387682.1 helix-turn-helix domain-containing protein [Bariatricus massiliensis]MCB7411843.1 helix-turn-helix domain-containing protein [Bariatricus massiliensis]MCQ5253979.1 helix-turn-helix domain-containing protein [Bariatricus massiliensis]
MYKRNLTIRQVSILTDIPKSSIENIMSGKTDPRLGTLERLAKGLNIRISDLYDSPFK